VPVQNNGAGRRDSRVQSADVCSALQRADDLRRECVLPSRRTSAVVAVINGEADQQGSGRPWEEGRPPKVSSGHDGEELLRICTPVSRRYRGGAGGASPAREAGP
jgi:hypothetical protein